MQRLNPEQRQEVFDRICKLAIAGNRRLLRELLTTHNVTISFTVRECTPIRHLAIHGHVEAVNFLIERFNANPYEALLGYGIANNTAAAQQLITSGISDKMYVMGLAQCGNMDAILKLGDKLEDNTYRTFILTGMAIGGHVALIRQLPFSTAYHLVDTYIFGLAFSGQTEELNKELALGAKKSMAIWGHAAAGRVKEVEELLGQIDKNNIWIYLPAVVHAASGYAASGYVELTEALLQRGNVRNMLAFGFAKAGIKYKVDEFATTKHAKEEAMSGYLESHAIKEAVSMLPQEESIDIKISNLDKLIQSYKSACMNDDNPDLFLNICSHIPDLHQLIFLCYRPTAPENARAQVPTAYRLNTLMRTYDLDFHAAKRALEINTQPGVKTWLLQGRQVLPFDIYLRITAMVINLPAGDVQKIFDMVNDFLLINIVSNQSTRHTITSAVFSLFGGRTFEQNAGVRHQERRLGFGG